MRRPGREFSRLLPKTTQGTILLLLLVAIVPVVLLQVGAYYRSLQARQAAELQSDLELARSVAATFDAYRQDVLHQELAIGLAFTSARPLSPQDGQQYLLANVQAYPTVGEYRWVSAQGQVIASSRPDAAGRDESGLSDYRTVAAGPDWAVSDLSIDPLTGEPTFSIARAIRSTDGGLLGVVVASIEPQRLASVFPDVRGGQGSFSIADRSGRLVYRSPDTAFTWEQRDLNNDPLIRRALAGQEATGTFASGSEGSERIGAAAPIRSMGWVVWAGRPATAVKVTVLQSLGRSFGLFLLVALAAFGLAAVVGRQITQPLRRVHDYAASLGSGEPAPLPQISRPREVRELALTLGSMAGRLHARQEALQAKIAALDGANLALGESEKRYRQGVAENQRLIEALGQQVAALDAANAALQRAQRRLRTEREEERKALSRELHDEVIQELLSLKYQVQGLRAHPDQRADGLTDVDDNIRELIDDLRHICSDLRPPTIDSLGVGVAIQSYTYDWSARAGIAVHLDLDDQVGRLPEALELSIFRIVQEALSNVRKHAHASTVYITLRRESPDTLLVSVRDDGCGMSADYDLAGLAAAGHYGLVGITERTELLDGRMKVQSQPGAGVLLQVEIPYPRVEGP